MVGKHLVGTALAVAAFLAAARAHADPIYVALGDSITFGETDLNYVQSNGDRGYVGDFANIIASQTGTRPDIVNLAIDGETAASFLNNSNPRTPPVVGRTNVPLQLENLNYNNSTALSQSQAFANAVVAEKAAGNTVTTISLTLGFNELGALAPMQNTPAAEAAAIAQIPATLNAFRTNDNAVLSEIRSLAPNATLYLNGYYNPFPADPSSPAAPIFAAGSDALNSIIQGLASRYGGIYVNNATLFVGNEAAYTYKAALPADSSVPGPYGGLLPIGDVHPNALGYQVIADDMASAGGLPLPPSSVPEPATWALLAAALGATGLFSLWPIRRAKREA